MLLRNVGEKSSVWREFSHAKRSGRSDKMWSVRDIWKCDSPRGDGNFAIAKRFVWL